MIFTGTAQQLADLTRPFWGAEWWPEGLVFRLHDPHRAKIAGIDNEWWFLDRAYMDSSAPGVVKWAHGSSIFDAEAAALIFAAAYVQIVDRGWSIHKSTDAHHRPQWSVIGSIDGRMVYHPFKASMLEAALEVWAADAREALSKPT